MEDRENRGSGTPAEGKSPAGNGNRPHHSRRGGRKHHQGKPRDAAPSAQNPAAERPAEQNASPDKNKGNREEKNRRDHRPGKKHHGDNRQNENRQNKPRQNSTEQQERQNQNRDKRFQGKRRDGNPSVQPPSVTPPARADFRAAQPFPFEPDEDPSAGMLPEDLPVLTAENYLDDPPCFASPAPAPASEGEKMTEIVGVRFRHSEKVYDFAPGMMILSPGEYVVVDTARGEEFGTVAVANHKIPEGRVILPLRPVFRRATEEDLRQNEENLRREKEALGICEKKIEAHGLEMKLVEAQYLFDRSKLLFYFTAENRVDFRELVKDLAGTFHTRIELRQIGIRDEAKLIGGLGACGRPLCCSSYLTDFVQVSIKMAKEQNLSLNSSKISGYCGRLMCCLRYEYDTYVEEIRRTPPVDAIVRTADGIGRVTSVNPLAGTIRVFLTETPDVPQKEYRREDVVVLQRERQKRSDNRPAPKEKPEEPTEELPAD